MSEDKVLVMEYKLRNIIKGHKSDVQSIVITDNDDILTGCIDAVIKLWRLNRSTNLYVESKTFVTDISISCRIASFCYIPPNDDFIYGLLASNGSRRNHDICIFSLHSSVCRYKLFGHTRSITKIVNGNEANTIVSASLDCNVIIWKLTKDCMNAIKTIHVDTNSVITSVLCVDDTICVGCNDNLIRLYNENGDCLFNLTGHTESVRDLVSYNNSDEILSCSNDKTIRRWNIRTKQCLNVMHGHKNFIFSMAVKGNRLASCGNDQSVLVWNDLMNYVKIDLHSLAGSIWSVRFLSNGDIVVGSRQGEIYFFTQHEHLYAEKSMMDKFYKQIEEDKKNMIKLMEVENAKSRSSTVKKDENIKNGPEGDANHDHDYLSRTVCDEKKKNEGDALFSKLELTNVPNQGIKKRNKRNVSKQTRLSPAKKRKNVFKCKICNRLFEIEEDFSHHQQLHLSRYEELYQSIPQNFQYNVKELFDFEDYCKIKIHLLDVNTREMAEQWIFKFILLNSNHHYVQNNILLLPQNQIFRKHFHCAFVNNLTGGICKNDFNIWIENDKQSFQTYVNITEYLQNSTLHSVNNAADAISNKCNSLQMVDSTINDISNILIPEGELIEEECVSNKSWEAVKETVNVEENGTPVPKFNKRANKKFIRSVKDNFNEFLLKLEDDLPYYRSALTAFSDNIKTLCESTPEERLNSLLDFNNSTQTSKK